MKSLMSMSVSRLMKSSSGMIQPLSLYCPVHIWSTVTTSASGVPLTNEVARRALSWS